MTQTQFYENQIFEEPYPPESAHFCNDSQITENRFHIEEIDSIQKEVENENGEVALKTVRRFQIKRNLAPSLNELKQNKRQERDYAIKDILWLLERHQQEQILNIPTTLSPSEHLELLEYIQTLRDIPQQPNFPHADLPEKPSFLTS